MSPMRSLSFQRPRATAFLLVAMFLFADLALHHTMEGWSELEEEHSPQHVLSTHYVNADTYISESNPLSTYNTSASGVAFEHRDESGTAPFAISDELHFGRYHSHSRSPVAMRDE